MRTWILFLALWWLSLTVSAHGHFLSEHLFLVLLGSCLWGRAVGLHRTPVLHGQTMGSVFGGGHALHGLTSDA